MKRVTAADNVLVHSFGDEAVLLNLNNEMYYSLNPSGFQMWQALTQTATLDEAVGKLGEVYGEVPADTLRADLEEFVASLASMELLHIVEA